MSTTITDLQIVDLRFPTSRELDGSDAMNPDPDYSAAYVILKTDHPDGLEGHGLTFTIGRGNDIVAKAIEVMGYLLKGRPVEAFFEDMGAFWRHITGDSQLRWLGPEKGVIHLATAAVVNAVWDLYAKMEGLPLWKLVAGMAPEDLVRSIDFTYLTDAITPGEALERLQGKVAGKAQRIAQMEAEGYPAYTTSAGWLGYGDEKIRRLCREAVAEGWNHVKMKVGANLEDDIRRASIIREEIGPDRKLMMDANQKWDVPRAIEWMQALKSFNPWWIEEPTSPDDVLGHLAIKKAIAPIQIATGEHCQNRVIFKQLMQAGALDFVQIDSCRLGGVNEVLSVLLLADKFNLPVCPHAGGVGLCEYVQHLSMIDYVAISGSLDNRVIEYVDHLHEHFLYPVHIVNARYQAPQQAGYSIDVKPETLRDYAFPTGKVWS